MITSTVLVMASVTAAATGSAADHASATPWYVTVAYLVAAATFILSLKWLSGPRTARRGIRFGEIGMAAAIIATLFLPQVQHYQWIVVAFIIGAAIGIPLALLMPMTAVPQRTALSHAFGALAAALVGTAEYFLDTKAITPARMAPIIFETLLGFLTTTGSLIAFGKLQEILPSQPMGHKHQNKINLLVFVSAAAVGVMLIIWPGQWWLYPIFAVLALIFGVVLVMPIGGADMPTVISLLNSYAGLSAAAMGFVLNNKLLIIAGALDGSSGFILSVIMCKAMNRSFTNVLFGRIHASKAASADEVYGGKVKSTTPDEVAMLLQDARRVVVVPGYGMAVAQAQFAIRDLFQELEARGTTVEFGIHPVAGRMPGHMNVLLAEAGIPYDHLKEMEEINPTFEETDVVIVIGANDVVNPDARDNHNSPIAGMPILEVDKARTVVVIKRSLSPGFAGIPNPLFAMDNTLMLFGDGKKEVVALTEAVKH
jgi:H+-translocating NAD(P) transhydrogenase subunit beta